MRHSRRSGLAGVAPVNLSMQDILFRWTDDACIACLFLFLDRLNSAYAKPEVVAAALGALSQWLLRFYDSLFPTVAANAS
jgi:hypothetical protein